MKVSAISDVHIKYPGDQASELFLKFLDNSFVRNSNYVFLLGDIFDLMCGPHPQYIDQFESIFIKIKKLMENGAKIYYFEGNHDLHLEKLFSSFFGDLPFYCKFGFFEKNIEGKKYLLSHGDEYDYQNQSYLFYRRFIQSEPLKYFAENILSYDLLNYLGQKASVKSRKTGSRYFDESLVREKFRIGVETLMHDKGYDFILGGHSHVQDFYKLNVKNGGYYLNNGFALKSKTFIAIDNHRPRFEELL